MRMEVSDADDIFVQCLEFSDSCYPINSSASRPGSRQLPTAGFSFNTSILIEMLHFFVGLKDIARLLREEQNPPASKNEIIKVENGRTVSLPVSKVFRYYNYFPDDFSILFTFRAMSLTDVYLVAMYDYRKHLSLGVRIKPDLISFEFEKISAFHQTQRSLDFAVKARKAQWHTLGISIRERNVTVFWDCKKAGSKNLLEKFSLIPDPLGELYVGKSRLVSSSERYEVS